MSITNGVLGHIVLNVADLKKSERFYQNVLGLKISARNRQTRMTFLSYGQEHHDIALQALPKGAKHVSGEGMSKLHHFCIYVDRNEVIDEIYPVLKRRKIPVVSGPETLLVAGNRSVSFLDPDGNRVEIACNANKFKYDNRKKIGIRKLAAPFDGAQGDRRAISANKEVGFRRGGFKTRPAAIRVEVKNVYRRRAERRDAAG